MDGRAVPRNIFGAYLLIAGGNGACTAAVTFPVREVRTVEYICYTAYTIAWRGDQIVAMSPPAEHRPMFPPCN